jgi:hypothetical protein
MLRDKELMTVPEMCITTGFVQDCGRHAGKYTARYLAGLTRCTPGISGYFTSREITGP